MKGAGFDEGVRTKGCLWWNVARGKIMKVVVRKGQELVS